jgi:hypothetical protein
VQCYDILEFFNPPAIKQTEAFSLTFGIPSGLKLNQEEQKLFKLGHIQLKEVKGLKIR